MQNSHFSASMAPPISFRFERPNQNELRSGSLRFDSSLIWNFLIKKKDPQGLAQFSVERRRILTIT